MFSVTWKTDKGITRVAVVDDRNTAQDLADMLISCQDTPSTILDMVNNTISFQHNFKEGDTVFYKGGAYKIATVIPGISVIYIRRPQDRDGLNVPVEARALTRYPA